MLRSAACGESPFAIAATLRRAPGAGSRPRACSSGVEHDGGARRVAGPRLDADASTPAASRSTSERRRRRRTTPAARPTPDPRRAATATQRRRATPRRRTTRARCTGPVDDACTRDERCLGHGHRRGLAQGAAAEDRRRSLGVAVRRRHRVLRRERRLREGRASYPLAVDIQVRWDMQNVYVAAHVSDPNVGDAPTTRRTRTTTTPSRCT